MAEGVGYSPSQNGHLIRTARLRYQRAGHRGHDMAVEANNRGHNHRNSR